MRSELEVKQKLAKWRDYAERRRKQITPEQQKTDLLLADWEGRIDALNWVLMARRSDQ